MQAAKSSRRLGVRPFASIANADEWLKRAQKELQGKTPTPTMTAEGIALKPLYTSDDAEGLDRSPPGVYPFGALLHAMR